MRHERERERQERKRSDVEGMGEKKEEKARTPEG